MNQFYFSINLNKFGEKTYQRLAQQRLFKNLVLTFVIITIVLYGAVIFFNMQLDAKFENRRQLLHDIRDEIERYREVGEYLSTRDLERLARTSTDRIFWANKLIALADVITDKIAITHFSYRNGVLSLYGVTQVEIEEKEFHNIYEFIELLERDPQIHDDFDEIKFVRGRRDREQEVDIIRFQIDCIGRRIPARERRRL